MKSLQKGFTLIELMIVIAIIGILAAIAIPAYQNYTIRAQVTEGLSLADSYKTGIAEYYQNNGTWPQGAAPVPTALQIPMEGVSSGKYVSGITVTAVGNIQIAYAGPQASAKLKPFVLFLQPGTDANGDVVWVCGTAVTPGTVTLAGAALTTVPAAYLPSSCHP
jgi:type IV pilus assembly protein PilA